MSEEVIIQIDNILRSVGATSLKTLEINYINSKGLPFDTLQQQFDSAVEIVKLRNIYGSYSEKLKNYALLNGLTYEQPKHKGFSNIFIGASLE